MDRAQSLRQYTDPATGNLVGTAPECDAEDVQVAIDAAAGALPNFKKTTGRQRSKLLRKWYDLVVCIVGIQ